MKKKKMKNIKAEFRRQDPKDTEQPGPVLHQSQKAANSPCTQRAKFLNPDHLLHKYKSGLFEDRGTIISSN